MKKNKLPNWLKKILDDTSLEQGKYTFEEDGVNIEGLPEEFIGVASCDGGGLAISKNNDEVIYRFENNQIDVYAVDEQEYVISRRRDDAWEELSENMPATNSFWLGIVLKTKTDVGEELTLGLKGLSKDSALVIQGKINTDEMLNDALNRELSEALMITDFEVADVLDDGGVMSDKDGDLPMFTVVVLVEEFDESTIGDPRVGWINMSKTKVVN